MFGSAVKVQSADLPSEVLVVCEHASNRLPKVLGRLGLDDVALQSHIAWDPGARGVAAHLAERLDAPLVTGEISRLTYDCNRPPHATSAIPERSEVYDIPGNRGLSDAEREDRVAHIYRPFTAALARQIERRKATLSLLVTIHSFTPEYHGKPRDVEIGILHGVDAEFAERMIAAMPQDIPHKVALNEPYSAADGVAHTLDLHGKGNGIASVMIEIRNDLIKTLAQQAAMAGALADWIDLTRRRAA